MVSVPLTFATLLIGLSAGSPVETTHASPSSELRKPIVSTSTFYETFDLLSDISETTYNVFIADVVAKNAPKVTAKVEEAFGELCKVTGVKQKEVSVAVETLRSKASVLKANSAEQIAIVQEKLDRYAAKVSKGFDGVAPRFAGVFPRTMGDLLFSAAYFALVAYTILRVILKVIRVCFSVFCYFCCCGMCCRRRAGAPKQNGKKPAPAAAKKSTKAKK
eukprot:TRINITY_DN44499_c0_g1_i1.p1 TRINITY_DN44499_c0_g1~~TRINITY_DN44499_c0_g1_i1.p1  ORF type:complete len:236 (-),score=37.18 TRINITY_DN44499_c0_g1_i1:343-999(-)